jgi:hypothetical protein
MRSPASRSVPTARSNAAAASGSPFFAKSDATSAARSPRTPPRSTPRQESFASAEAASSGSAPAIASSTRRVSSSVRPIGPILSSVQESAIAPWRLTRPYVGRSPVTPQKFEGQRIEPQVSVPIANGTSPPAIAAPLPEDEPPAQRPGSHGLRIGPCSEAFPTW